MNIRELSTKFYNTDYLEDTLMSQVSYLENKRVDPLPYTEEEAWNLATHGFKFKTYFEIGTLSYVDLFSISQYRPNVDLETYKSLQELSYSSLSKKAPYLLHFHPNVSKDDLFFYLTRGWLPYDVNIKEKVDRWIEFGKLLDINQNLMLLMYKTRMNFASVGSSLRYQNIEAIIFYYDKFLGLPTTPGILSAQMGIHVAIHSPQMHTYIYNKLYNYIETASVQTPFSEDDSEVLTMDEAIGYSKDRWEDFVKRNYPSQNIPYETRTDFVMETFYKL